MEWLRDAWIGWENYRTFAKPVALFFAVLLYLAMTRGKRSDAVGQMTGYSAVTALLCILPPTAAVLLIYQTRFYNYEWIWSLVPLTAVTALGGTLLLTERWRSWEKLNNICYNIVLAALIVGVILLCGRPGTDEWKQQTAPEKRAAAERVLTAAAEDSGGEEIYLWAPREILAHARVLDDSIKLLYGRNMWDNALNAYSYDSYPPELEDAFLWLEGAAENGQWSQRIEKADEPGGEITAKVTDGAEQITYALEAGANCIFLRDNLTEDAMKEAAAFSEANGLEIQRIEGYLFLKKR